MLIVVISGAMIASRVHPDICGVERSLRSPRSKIEDIRDFEVDVRLLDNIFYIVSATSAKSTLQSEYESLLTTWRTWKGFVIYVISIAVHFSTKIQLICVILWCRYLLWISEC